MPDVVGLGCSCIDFLGIVPRLPHLDEEIEMLESLQQGGGEVATALVALAKLGVSTTYLGKIGDDPIGAMMLREFADYGVATDHLVVVPGRRSLSAIVLVDRPSGKRSILAGHSTAGRLHPDEIPPDVIEEARVLHLDGTHIEAALAATERARAAGVTVVLDADIPGLGPRIGALIERAHVVIASQPFAIRHTGLDEPRDAVEALRRAGPETAVVTLGEAGGIGWTAERFFRYSAFAVEAVDTTGAGDVFHGAYIRGLLAGWPLEQTVRFAAAVAALKCTQLGGRSGIPNPDAAEAFIRRRADAFHFEYL